MSILSITKKHHLSHEHAKRAAEQVAKDLRARFELDYKWHGDRIEFARPGLSGELHIAKDHVRLDCQLGLLFSTLKPAIEREVHREFDKRFGPPGG